MSTIILESNNFYQQVKNQIAIAQQTGALQSIPTAYEIVQDGGIDFVVRILTNLVRKEESQKKEAVNPDFNPFLPYESDLFVTNISDTHLCLLNKYNVVDEHLLIVTREFEEQENLLNFADFLALWAILAQGEGLGFYNAGKIAGASVKHKHLQLIPLELAPGVAGIPIEKIISNGGLDESIGMTKTLPFSHAYTKLKPGDNVEESAKISLNNYQRLLNSLNLAERCRRHPLRGAPYNLLMTREWMLVIPRSQPCYQNIGINSLGFAGGLLVRNQDELDFVKKHQPLNILKAVGVRA